MKKDIHPTMRAVVFRDNGSNAMFRMLSTIETDKRITYTDGVEYPLVDIEVSSATHPFYTGTQQLIDTAGRIERFNKRYNVGATKKK